VGQSPAATAKRRTPVARSAAHAPSRPPAPAPDVAAGSAEQEALLAELLERRLLIDTGVAGVYGRGGDFERVREGVAALVTRASAAEAPEQLRFPPVLPRHDLETVGYLKSFPHLAGSIFAFDGSEADASEQFDRACRHEDWSEFQSMSELVLTPAACYPVYPAIAKRGPLPPGGVTVDAGGSYVFRHEPSRDPARLQMFHQREIVRIGEPTVVQQWRDLWRDRAVELLSRLRLDVALDVASDPFFGRNGRMLASSQREQQLKFEVLTQIAGPKPTAIASFNYHQEHFASAYSIELADGGLAHTACLGFGLERVTIALFRNHGFVLETWPDEVRRELLHA
jgi:seryl-tRNA synthetase